MMAGHVHIDPSASSGFDDCRSLAMAAALPLPRTRGIYSSFPYASPPLPPPFQYAPPYLHSSLSLPPLPPRRRPLHQPQPVVAMPKYAELPPSGKAGAGKPAAQAGSAAAPPLRRTGTGLSVSYKSKKPRTPRLGEDPPRAQRRKPLERATPLPPSPAVHEALDDLEREVTRGFVQDLMHALAPPPSSLPLPTFSLVRAAGAVKAAASCTV